MSGRYYLPRGLSLAGSHTGATGAGGDVHRLKQTLSQMGGRDDDDDRLDKTAGAPVSAHNTHRDQHKRTLLTLLRTIGRARTHTHAHDEMRPPFPPRGRALDHRAAPLKESVANTNKHDATTTTRVRCTSTTPNGDYHDDDSTGREAVGRRRAR